MSTSLTYYQTNTASAVLATANQLLANVATGASVINNNTNLTANTLGWVELWSQGDGSAQTGASVKPGPSGHGWIDDSGTLTGNVFNSGNWIQTLPLETTTTGSFIADIHFRAYKYTAGSGTYTFIAELILSAQTVISTAYTNFVISALNAAASGQLASGEHTYTDCLLNILTNGTTGNVRVRMANSSTAGSTSAQLVTPGYNTAAYNAQQMIYDELQVQYARIRASSFVTNNDLSLLGFTYYVPAQILNEHTLPGELDALFNWETWDNLHTMRTVNDVTDFLGGTVNQLTIYNVKDSTYGAIGDGTTDDTNAIAAANQAASVNGGILYTPPGTFITGPQTIYPKVHYTGCGAGVSTWKLKAGSNGDLLSGQTSLINLSAAANSGSVGTLLNFAICGMSLDGNKANQSAGPSWPLRFYGYNFLLRDVEVLNGYSGGAQTDWNGGGTITQPSPQMESTIDNCKFHDNGGIGLQIGGPHDTRLHNVLWFFNDSHQLHIAPNADGLLLTNCHAWGCPNTAGVCAILDEATSGTQYANCEVEGSYYYNLYLLGQSKSWIGGSLFSPAPGSTPSVVGIQLGQNSGNTPLPGQINQSAGVTTTVVATGTNINTVINECRNAGINFVNESNGTVIANVFQTAGSYVLGTPSTTDFYIIRGSGLTADGTLAKSGGVQMLSGSLQVFDSAGRADFQVSSSSSGVSGFNVPGTLQIISNGTGYNTGGNTGIALLIDPGGNAKRGVVVFAHSVSQSAPLLVVQNESFADTFTVDKNGNVVEKSLAINTGTNATIAALVTPGADANTGLVIYPNSSSQSAPLFATQNASFANVFTIDKNGNTVAQTISVGQSATTPDPGAGGTVATAGVGLARLTPAANRTGLILQAGTTAGQQCSVVNNSGSFTLQFAASGTSHVAPGTGLTIAVNGKYDFIWDSVAALWY